MYDTRRLSLIVLAVALGSCGGGAPWSPTPPIDPPRPTPAPVRANLSGTLSVTTALTAGGGYEYSIAIRLSETSGVAARIERVEVAPTDAWGPYPPIATFGAEAWQDGDGSIAAHGTLNSKPLRATVETIFDYYRPITATIVFSDSTSPTSREKWLEDSTQRPPEPPASSRLALTGKVVDGGNHPLSEVEIELFDGANSGRTTTTDASGTFRLADLSPGKFFVRFSKPDYASTFTSVDLASNLSFNFMLRR